MFFQTESFQSCYKLPSKNKSTLVSILHWVWKSYWKTLDWEIGKIELSHFIMFSGNWHESINSVIYHWHSLMIGKLPISSSYFFIWKGARLCRISKLNFLKFGSVSAIQIISTHYLICILELPRILNWNKIFIVAHLKSYFMSFHWSKIALIWQILGKFATQKSEWKF